MILLESIGSVSRQLSYVPRISDLELLVADDCPEAEQISNSSDSNNAE
jgi:hypothetical protein